MFFSDVRSNIDHRDITTYKSIDYEESCQLLWPFYYPGQKNWNNRAEQKYKMQARELVR